MTTAYLHDRQMETLDRPTLERLQLAGVQALLERLHANSPFWHGRLQQAGVMSVRSLEEFRDKVPFVTKKDLMEDQEALPPFGRRLPVSETDIVQIHMTSGSSGQGQEVYPLTAADRDGGAYGAAMGISPVGFEPGDISGVLWPVATMPGGLIALDGAQLKGLNPMILGIYSSEMKLRLMKRFPTKHFFATPAYLSRLTVLCREMGLEPRRDFPHLKGIHLSTESFPPTWVATMEEFWGCTVFDCYGTSQIGTMYAYCCERGAAPGGRTGWYHLIEHSCLVEVINPTTNEPAKWGEEGEPIITTFGRQAAPLVRFRQGDKVRLLEPGCACGRTSARWEAGTIARYDDMLKIKAVNVWPSAVDVEVFARPEIDEYNGVVSIDERGQEQALIRLEFKPGGSSPESQARLIEQLRQALHERIGLHFAIELVAPGSLERFEYKARRWRDEREQGLERVRYTERD